MCLINFSFHSHSHFKLIVAANRDEMYERPTAPAHFWEDQPSILAGRDLVQMGTWFGITKEGRFAALTNYRDLTQSLEGKISRGHIVQGFLQSNEHPMQYLQSLHEERHRYQGFNVIVGNADELYYYSNMGQHIKKIESGVHSVSNHLLNTPWPKVERGKQRLKEYITSETKIDQEPLFDLLLDQEIAQDDRLPETGVGLELERQLSPLFIRTPKYGTRSSTVLLIDQTNHVSFTERTFHQGKFADEISFSFPIKN